MVLVSAQICDDIFLGFFSQPVLRVSGSF